MQHSQRAFLGIGLASACGAAMGSACSSVGRVHAAGSSAAGDGADTAELQPGGDAFLDELRRLAIKAPIEELSSKGIGLLVAVQRDYPSDHVLWLGVARLATALLEMPRIGNRRVLAQAAAVTIEGGSRQHAEPHQHLVAPLRTIR